MEFTIRYTVIVTVLLIGIGLLLALIVQESGRWSGILRTVFLLPLAVGLAAASLLFWGFYSPTIGPLNPLLQAVGLIDEPILFFAEPENALLATVFLIVWKFVGFYMLILLVGLQQIPADVYEAAAIDGASRWQTLSRITLPLLRPSLALGADPLRDRLAARVRPVLPADEGRPGQLDRHHRPAHLPAGLRAPEPRGRGCAVDGAARGAAGPEPHLVPAAAARDGGGMTR